MTISILFCCFCLVALAGQGEKCEATKIYNATSGIEAFIEYWFSQDIEFNGSCVAEGCPDLKDMSFCSSDLDIDAMRNITKTLSKCMSGPICGKVIDFMPVKSLTISMDQFLPSLAVKGFAITDPGAGYLTNISNIQLDAMSNQSQHSLLQMTMSMTNIQIRGHYRLDISMKTSLGPDLTARLTKTTYDIGIQYTSILSINHTGPNLDIKFVNPIIMARPQLCGIDLPTDFPNIQSLFTTTLQMIYADSSMATAISQFMVKLYRAATEIVIRNC